MLNKKNQPTVSLFLGAGFAKSWGLPLASEIMDMESIREKEFPGKWQIKLLKDIESLWNSTIDKHNGEVDEFGRLLHETNQFQDFAIFLALRLSSRHWHVGTANETKWGTGDHICKKKNIPSEYREFLNVFKAIKLIGIVTTNYDIMIEKLLGPFSTGRLGGFNYGIYEEQLIGRHSVNSRWSYGPVTITGKIPLLKLHGSLNWALEDDKLVKYIDCRPSRGKRYKVILLPPGNTELHRYLEPIWNQAYDVLSNSDIWIFCGYSIPDYDSSIRNLLKSASIKVSKICVCDVDPAPVRERISEFFEKMNRSVQIEDNPGITKEFNSYFAKKLYQILIDA